MKKLYNISSGDKRCGEKSSKEVAKCAMMVVKGRSLILNRVVREGLSGKDTFEQRPQGVKGMSHVDIWDKQRVQQKP